MAPKLRTILLQYTRVLCQLSLLIPLSLQAADLALPPDDVIAPEIQHLPLLEKIANNDSQIISATVTDDVAVQSVILFFRSSGTLTFNQRRMNRVGDTDIYSATLRTEELISSGLEYYIQAKDLAGNKILRGHSFTPLTIKIKRKITDDPSSSTTERLVNTSTQDPQKKSLLKNKWFWIAGAVILGAAAGGGDGDGEKPSETGNLAITVPAP
ncbi:MAG: hypothetical protein KUG82_09060 [Pseudomonadales bacterium]|nr:hypothetical protein [Pseudomonadales bacterium]